MSTRRAGPAEGPGPYEGPRILCLGAAEILDRKKHSQEECWIEKTILQQNSSKMMNGFEVFRERWWWAEQEFIDLGDVPDPTLFLHINTMSLFIVSDGDPSMRQLISTYNKTQLYNVNCRMCVDSSKAAWVSHRHANKYTLTINM